TDDHSQDSCLRRQPAQGFLQQAPRSDCHQRARQAGAEVTYLDLRDYPLPIFDEDLEKSAGAPENAKKLKKLFVEHHGFLISAPEYNSSITAVLKNTIDWISRPVQGEP